MQRGTEGIYAVFPKPGWVEHDAEEIWATQLEVAKEAMANIQATAADICAIGITNQRRPQLYGTKIRESRFITR